MTWTLVGRRRSSLEDAPWPGPKRQASVSKRRVSGGEAARNFREQEVAPFDMPFDDQEDVTV